MSLINDSNLFFYMQVWNAVSVMILFWTAVSLFKSIYFILLSIDFASLNPQQENQFKGQRSCPQWGYRVYSFMPLGLQSMFLTSQRHLKIAFKHT